MFVRIRWFFAGILAALGGMSYLVNQVRRARRKLTPANVVAAGKQQAARWLDAAADKVAPDEAGSAGR